MSLLTCLIDPDSTVILLTEDINLRNKAMVMHQQAHSTKVGHSGVSNVLAGCKFRGFRASLTPRFWDKIPHFLRPTETQHFNVVYGLN